jgi:hypothetical protein
MENVQKKVVVKGETLSNLNSAIFQKHANASILKRYSSLFPGIGFGAAYKILQRVYKFGGQPYVNTFIGNNFSSQFKSLFGDKNAKTMIYAVAGSLMGIGEIFLLPLDVLKIKAQTNPESFRGRGVVKVITDEGLNLYRYALLFLFDVTNELLVMSDTIRGASWTAARNAPGSFALFGGSAFMKDYVFKLERYSDATFFQDSIASVVGACSSIAAAQPLDVIKTRIQKNAFSEARTSGFTIIASLIKNEGFGAFFKGLTPKILVVGPKLVFSFTIAQQLMSFIDKK